jgi:hypothetical protein
MGRSNSTGRRRSQPPGITQISVSGYKSINREQSIEIRPLTILAGANSSGKSSIMQPLLLLKQTLEADYDPADPLLISGPNVKFTSTDQLLSWTGTGKRANTFYVGVGVDYVGVGAEGAVTVYNDPRKGGSSASCVKTGEVENQWQLTVTGELPCVGRVGVSH